MGCQHYRLSRNQSSQIAEQKVFRGRLSFAVLALTLMDSRDVQPLEEPRTAGTTTGDGMS